MTLKQLQSYKHNQRELAAVNQSLDNLHERLANVEIVSGKVSKSGDEYPYIEEHVTVEMQKPTAADPIRNKIIEKECRKKYLQRELAAVEDYINGLPEGMDKEILSLVYIDGMAQA
ncbi:MAG: hypothetical protein LUD72_06585, partial [Bacteroidales bacterium]|nr:hypothetical protein [Bacteroidales bacterium]